MYHKPMFKRFITESSPIATLVAALSALWGTAQGTLFPGNFCSCRFSSALTVAKCSYDASSVMFREAVECRAFELRALEFRALQFKV